MSYLLQVTNQRPMLRVTAEVVLMFCCAAPVVLAFSSFVAYGLTRSRIERRQRNVQHAFSIPPLS